MNLVSEGIQFIKEVYERRKQIYDLTKRDFTDSYTGSFLGFIWAFIEPLAMMTIMWAVFSLGLKVRPSGNIPFVAYLFTGMTAYELFTSTIRPSSGVIKAYSFLVKKVKFRIAILPIVKILSALILHLIFLFIVLAIIWISGVAPSLMWFQILYYTFALVFFMLGLSWLLSAVGVFVRDISNFIGILLTFGFWLTPIFWEVSIVPEKYRVFLCINPVFYIVQGYRDSLLYNIPFWDHPIQGLYFWSLSIVTLLVGILVFKKLRPHFADVI